MLFLGARVRRLATHPTEQSWVVSAVQGNNEVTVWDLETGARRQALWASHTPPLSQTQVCYRKLLLMRSQPRSQGSLLGENPGNEVDKIWAFTSNAGALISVEAYNWTRKTAQSMAAGAHNPERTTPILGLCHGVYTDRFIFRHIL